MKPSVRRTWGNLYVTVKSWGFKLSLIATVCAFPLTVSAQQMAAAEAASSAATGATSPVPQLVNYTGTLSDVNGKPLTGLLGVTFLLYKESQGGAPLWMETQNVHPDKTGHYSVVLGSATSQGLPQDVFASGEARWLAVQIAGQEEQPRVLLVAVPYALKAGDAETIGGLPPSAFVLANGTPGIRSNGNASMSSAPASTKTAASANPAVTGKGVVDFIPMWDATNDIIDSLIFQKSSNVGIATTAPAATLDVNGKSDVRDTLTLFPKGTDSTLAVNGTTFKIDQTGKVNFVTGQTFPGTGTITGVTTATGSGLTGGGTKGTLALGLTKTCSAKQVLQWNGTSWACSSTGSGTITGVTTANGSGLRGGGTSGTLNLSVNPAVVPELGAANTFTNTNTVNVSNNSSPALTLANPAGNGLNISNAGTNGIYIASTGNGIVMASVVGDGIDVQGAAGSGINAIGQNDGGYFNGRVAGSYAQNDVDGDGSAAAYGYETGSSKITYGVVGYSASQFGIGTYGQAISPSTAGQRYAGTQAIGVWGDTSNGTGVLGSSDIGSAIVGISTSEQATAATFENDESVTGNSLVLVTIGRAFNGSCGIDVSGNLFCTGTKSAVVPLDGDARKVALYSVESPENWFEDAGSSQLSNGSAVISLESIFAQTVNAEMDYHVFLTPKGDCEGLYVSNETPTGFEVHELRNGHSSIAFDYRIMAKRKGYEQIRLADKTKVMNLSRPKRREGPPVVMPTQLETRKAHEPNLRTPRPAQLMVNEK